MCRSESQTELVYLVLAALALVLRTRIGTGTKLITALYHNIDSTTTLARGAKIVVERIMAVFWYIQKLPPLI